MNREYSTRYTKYGHGIDVRKTYEGLPLQAFWTWVTGKSLNSNSPKSPKETLRSVWQLMLQVSWGYAVFFVAVIVGQKLINSDLSWSMKVLLSIPIFCMVVNRSRGLLHTGHYTIHGATLVNKNQARFFYKWILSIPVLHTPWENYMKIHVRDHHGINTFSTERDVDLVYMTQHGFYKGMKEKEFWIRLVLAPFHPLRIYEHLNFRFRINFVNCETHEKISRLTYWTVLLIVAYATGYMEAFLIFYVCSILLVTQLSSWVQHITEHLWFSTNSEGLPKYLYYGSLSWGRFFGRPYPKDKTGLPFVVGFIVWLSGTLLIDIPLRVFAYMQDLPSHDFHHRAPGVNFWSIAPERAANEALPSRFGPMTETWSMKESLLIVRDHLCRDESDPFQIRQWHKENSSIYESTLRKKSSLKAEQKIQEITEYSL
jgi:hypothetical protein